MLAAVVDVLFPPRCAACRELLSPTEALAAPGALCSRCEVTLEPIGECCRRCGLPGEGDGICADCVAHPPAFDTARAAFLYGGAIADVLQRFKYEDQSTLAGPLGAWIAALDLPTVDVLVPIPLHGSRRRARTYDQALYLARIVARRRGWPCESNWLTRVRATPRQVGQHRGARALNVQGAFRASPNVAGLTVLLVDDVVTTGATASECAHRP